MRNENRFSDKFLYRFDELSPIQARSLGKQLFKLEEMKSPLKRSNSVQSLLSVASEQEFEELEVSMFKTCYEIDFPPRKAVSDILRSVGFSSSITEDIYEKDMQITQTMLNRDHLNVQAVKWFRVDSSGIHCPTCSHTCGTVTKAERILFSIDKSTIMVQNWPFN